MNRFCAFVLLLFASANCFGQEQASSVVTTAVAREARFEIIQTPWDKNTTFRLDKNRGIIDRLATCTKDDSYGSNKCWKEMIVLDVPRVGSITHARFQIVMNVLLRTTFLLDTDTGLSWQYGLEPTEKWHPFIDCRDKTNNACFWRPLP